MFRTHQFYFVFCMLMLSLTAQAKPDAILHNREHSLRFENGQFFLQKNNKPLFQLSEIVFNYEPIKNWKVLSNQNNILTITADLPPSVDFYRAPTDNQPRHVTLTISAENNQFHFYAAPDWGRQITLNFKHLGDHFFGLSAPLQQDNQLSPDLTGTVTNVDIHSEGAAYRENYASAFSAFYMSTHGYAGFFDTFARGRYEFALNGRNRIHHDTGTLDWYVFTGDNGVALHKAYFDLIGAPKKVPAWALGPVGWRDQNDGGAKEIIDDIEKLNQLEIPFTSWFVDRPYSDGNHAWSQMNFSQAFTNPKQWIGKIRNDFGLEFMTWVSTATFGDARFAKHLAGKFTYLDLSDPTSVKQYQQELINKHYSVGVKGHKIDRADEGFPESEDWQDGTEIAFRRNKYAYLMAQAHDQALRTVWGDDQVTFARTAIHRTQPYLSAIWGGDPRTSWEGLQGNFANAMRSSFMGFPVWGTDVGGYQGDGFIPEDLYIRWMQAGSMTGLFEIKLDGAGGSGKDRMPWQYSAQFQQQFKNINADRMQLLPYLHSLANTSASTGVLMQPLAYRHLKDPKTYAIWDQFYVGDALLVAPIFDQQLKRTIYLPQGQWRNYDQPQQVFKGNQTISFNANLNTLPRFIKENSLYVTGDVYRGNDRLWLQQKPSLTLHAYPATNKAQSQFRYVDLLDSNASKDILMVSTKKQIALKGPAIKALTKTHILLAKKPNRVTLNGAEVTPQYDVEKQLLEVIIEADRAFEITITL